MTEAAAVEPTTETPRRTFRASNELWDAYSEVCAQQGTDAAKDLRAHMARKITTARRGTDKRRAT